MSDVRAFPGIEVPESGNDDPTSGKVIPLGVVTRIDLPPDEILERAKGKVEGVVMIGFDKDNSFYFDSSYADGGTVLWLLERAKQRLMEVSDEF